MNATNNNRAGRYTRQEARSLDRQRPADVREVLNYIVALRHGLEGLPILFLRGFMG